MRRVLGWLCVACGLVLLWRRHSPEYLTMTDERRRLLIEATRDQQQHMGDELV